MWMKQRLSAVLTNIPPLCTSKLLLEINSVLTTQFELVFSAFWCYNHINRVLVGFESCRFGNLTSPLQTTNGRALRTNQE